MSNNESILTKVYIVAISAYYLKTLIVNKSMEQNFVNLPPNEIED